MYPILCYVEKLSNTECRTARPVEQEYKLYDEGNLQLLVRNDRLQPQQYNWFSLFKKTGINIEILRVRRSGE